MPKSTRECIREMSIRGSSQREIARTLGVSRNTVAKYLAEDLSPKAPVTRTPASPTMAPYADEVRGWLESTTAWSTSAASTAPSRRSSAS